MGDSIEVVSCDSSDISSENERELGGTRMDLDFDAEMYVPNLYNMGIGENRRSDMRVDNSSGSELEEDDYSDSYQSEVNWIRETKVAGLNLKSTQLDDLKRNLKISSKKAETATKLELFGNSDALVAPIIAKLKMPLIKKEAKRYLDLNKKETKLGVMHAQFGHDKMKVFMDQVNAVRRQRQSNSKLSTVTPVKGQ